MKTLFVVSALALVGSFAEAQAAPPAPITVADVPNSVTAPLNATAKVGVVKVYNDFVASEYAALPVAQQATYIPPAVNAFILNRLASVVQDWVRQANEADFGADSAKAKWPSLTQAQRDQIKAIFATVP
jgi:hypothetical protein